MTASLQVTTNRKISITYTSSLTLGSSVDKVISGTATLASMDSSFANGTGAGNANLRHCELYSFAAGDTTFDLTAIATTRPPASTQAFALIKLLILQIVNPVTGVKLLIGNYGANGFLGGLSANTVTKEVRSRYEDENRIDGWLVDGTHKGLKINNPGGSPVPAVLIIIGE